MVLTCLTCPILPLPLSPSHNESVCPSVRPVVDPGCPPPSLLPLPSSSHSLPELLIQSDCAQEKNRVGRLGHTALGPYLSYIRIEGREVGINYWHSDKKGGGKKIQKKFKTLFKLGMTPLDAWTDRRSSSKITNSISFSPFLLFCPSLGVAAILGAPSFKHPPCSLAFTP